MNDYCAFSKNHKCLKWIDYELTKQELKDYIVLLQSLLEKNGIEYPNL